jgi:hypothetical protein
MCRVRQPTAEFRFKDEFIDNFQHDFEISTIFPHHSCGFFMIFRITVAEFRSFSASYLRIMTFLLNKDPPYS